MMKTKQATARLERWAYDKKQNVIVGFIYDDVNGRFADGAMIKTSKLKPMSMQTSTPSEGALISTLNSVYLLGEKK